MVLWLATAAALSGCAAGGRTARVPQGVSPHIAARADSIGTRLFVARERERKADWHRREGIRHYHLSDSLWTLVDARRDAVAETLTTAAAALNGTPSPAGRTGTDPELRKNTILATYHLMEAQRNLSKALQYHGFNPQAQHYLALAYKLLSERYPSQNSFDKAIELWESLARLEPGEYLHRYNLGATYFAKHDWQRALHNYASAEDLLLRSAAVSPRRLENPALSAAAAIDSLRLLSSVFYQAQSAIKLEDAPRALHHLERAKSLTTDPAVLAAIAQDIHWINWDDGNIRASVLRDSATTLVNQGKYAEAGKIYNLLLDKLLRTPRARHDVTWDFATIEYVRLGRRASAIARLDEVMKSIPTDAAGAPLDTTYRRNFDTYGRMCLRLATDTARVNRRVGYEYLERAARIACKDRGRIFLEMADLSKPNPEISIANAERALEWEQSFDTRELRRLYDLLVEGYRHKNKPDEARKYFKKRQALP
ncbi:MAG: hypothetical protein ONB51_07595 [candidate division KSB1 bacterium]|nr:hypothetical protein [candidate division KSB1 bacterium]MDZ7306270.1 hypothetical protein [candidate division KSB1 bacterium]MDZ7409089.1 hypothetical protein [candidate division KSB1 bacterium]